ncbi:Ribose ABC transport system, permease protein RbsC (TC 3.A.1.2.1) [Richelia intracellularis]|nr:Ribose ABC transport system, permease protein RbsC (TC 3.A.1.2.1) [Richelia intracellularis]
MNIPYLADIPIIGKVIFQQDIFVYLLIIIVIATTYFLFYTHPSLTLRTVGEYPQAATYSGISVIKVRYLAVVMSVCLASLGGAYLSLVQVKYFLRG